MTYGVQGRHEDALEYGEKALAMRRETLSGDHPLIATSMMNLADSYVVRVHFSACVRIERSGCLLLIYFEVVSCYLLLFAWFRYCLVGRHEDARILEEEALEIRRRILPKDHPRIASSMTNLAVTYDALGMHEDAAKMEEDALKIRKRTLPTVRTSPLFAQLSRGLAVGAACVNKPDLADVRCTSGSSRHCEQYGEFVKHLHGVEAV